MDKKEESRIQSTGVSIGSSPSPSARAKSKRRPWNILVCADLGYTSSEPRRVLVSEWKEFVGNQGAVISGTVRDPFAGHDVYVEYPMRALQDLSDTALSANVAHIAPVETLRNTLAEVLEGTLDRNEALGRVRNAAPQTPAHREAQTLLAAPGRASQAPPASAGNAASVDRILDSIATPEETASDKPKSDENKPVDALMAAASDSDASLPRRKIASLSARLDNAVKEQLRALHSAPFMRAAAGSWMSLRELTRTIGRGSQVRLHVFSGAAEETAEKLSSVVRPMLKQGDMPDLILWDYPVRFTTAQMELARQVAETADKYKAMVLMPVDEQEPVIESMAGADTLKGIVDDSVLIPFARLRRNAASRCVALCAPAVKLRSDQITVPAVAGLPWLMLKRIVAALLEDSTPFEVRLPQGSGWDADSLFAGPVIDITPDIAGEAAGVGLTVAAKGGNPHEAPTLTTLVDTEVADEPYTHFGYNLLVNRTSRIAARFVMESAEHQDGTTQVPALREFLLAELEPYGIFTSKNDLRITTTEPHRICIVAQSEATLGEHPIRMQIELG